MGFTVPCFIRKNTPELRKKLEEFGYVIPDITIGEAIFTLPEESKIYTEFLSNIIDDEIAEDCGENEELFLALAAKRDDTSANQYWVFDKDFLPHYKKGDFTIGYFDRCSCYCHVATAQELIQHFK